MDVEIRNLKKAYGEKVVFDGLSCKVKEHSWNLLSGESGVGKTTLLRMILSLEKSDAGEIVNLPKKRSAVFQEHRLFTHMCPVDYLKAICGCGDEEIREGLATLGMANTAKQPIEELSGGMKKRIEILAAVLSDAELVLLDEPFSGLDPDNLHTTIRFCIEKTKGKTVLLATHHKEEYEMLLSAGAREGAVINL